MTNPESELGNQSRPFVENEELWRAVLRTAADPVILIDEAGVMLQVNSATTKLFGYSIEDLVGSNVSMLMPEPYRSEHDSYLQRYLTTGEARIIGIGREVRAQRADGSTLPMALAVSEVVTTAGRMFTGIVHDLAERQAAEDRLREASETLEQKVKERTIELESSMAELARSNRDLEQFAYIASHDLQAPLRNVRQGLEMLDEHLNESVGHGLDEEAKELRSLIMGSASRMEDLIRGLLTYSRIHRKAMQQSSVDLGKITDQVITQLGLDLGAVNASVSTNELPTIQGDATQFHQLFQNLIENAVKYRDTERAPVIDINASETDTHWIVSLADNGIGVDKGQHERIFELFRRGHPGYEGVGLGLAICQRIVERHGGEIWVESKPGQGSVFTFTVPRAPSTKMESLDATRTA